MSFADRSQRAKLRFTGSQRAWFLHQILTQSFEDIQEGEARDAALITPTGRMIGLLEALASHEAILCHFEPELRDSLPAAIARYVLATQVEIADVTEEMGLVLVVGGDRERWHGLAHDVALVHETSSLGVPACYLWVGRSDVEGLLLALEQRGLSEASEDDLEELRIAHGVGRWGRDMDETTIPLEVGLAERAIHFTKGCYVGQEAMAKIQFRGKVNRVLRKLEADAPLETGVQLMHGGSAVGRVTSVAGTRALGIVRHDVEPGVELAASGTRVRVVA